jgi:CheY-like chemotaxis protein
MPEGGFIEISAENMLIEKKSGFPLEPGKYVKVTFRDWGIGMPVDMIQKIFDPFYTTKEKGHGLGLATSYSILNKHGGHIDVESEPGKGTAFHIFLPASEGNVSNASCFDSVSFRGSGTILVMDDEMVIRDIICEMLRSVGFDAKAAKDGREAIDILRAEMSEGRVPVAMIFDLTIPGGMGGKEAIGEIRKICADVPVFVSSGYAEDPIMAGPREYGFTDSICKPFKRMSLIKMLKKHLVSS